MKKIRVLFRGITTFKDWIPWLLWRFQIVERDNNVRLFRLRNGEQFYFRAKETSGAGMFQELCLQNDYFKNYAVQPNDIAIDIGAHIGIVSVQMARAGARVFSYEPNPSLYGLLEKNIKENKVSRIYPARLAVAKEAGERDFWGQTMVYEASLHPETKQYTNETPIKVRTTTLEDIFKVHDLNHCDFLKMDCEGSEFEILLNAPPAILQKIKHMVIEYHFEPQAIIQLLTTLGFKVERKETSNGLGHIYADKT